MSSADSASRPAINLFTYKVEIFAQPAVQFFGLSVTDISLAHIDPVFLEFDVTGSLTSTMRATITAPRPVAAVTPVTDNPSTVPLYVATEDARGDDGGNTAPATTVPIESPLIDVEISDPTYYLLKYLRFAAFPMISDDPEFVVADFARELLRALGFQTRTGLLFTRYPLPFLMGPDPQVASPDLSLFGTENGMILLLVQTNRQMPYLVDAEEQLVTAAIAAFDANNKKRPSRGKPVMTEMVFPGIVMVRSCPTFYKIPVTAALSRAVRIGMPLEAVTHVAKCVVPSRAYDGMEVPKYRADALRYFIAFKALVETLRSQYD